MDVSVLGDPTGPTDISKHQVAQAAGSSIALAIASGDENKAMQIMAKGAAGLTVQLHAGGQIDAMLVLGGYDGHGSRFRLCAGLTNGGAEICSVHGFILSDHSH